MNYIAVEPALFGDMYIAVYDENDEPVLGKKYFVPTIEIAMAVAKHLQRVYTIERDDSVQIRFYQYDATYTVIN